MNWRAKKKCYAKRRAPVMNLYFWKISKRGPWWEVRTRGPNWHMHGNRSLIKAFVRCLRFSLHR